MLHRSPSTRRERYALEHRGATLARAPLAFGIATVARPLGGIGFDAHADRAHERDARHVLRAELDSVERVLHHGAGDVQSASAPLNLGLHPPVTADELNLGRLAQGAGHGFELGFGQVDVATTQGQQGTGQGATG